MATSSLPPTFLESFSGTSISVDDMVDGMNDWRNIQDVVRQTFKALNDVVKIQGNKIKQLENQLENCVHVSELKHLEVSLSNKPTFAEVNRITGEIIRECKHNPMVEDLQSQLRQKAGKDELQELYAGITIANSKLESRETEVLVKELQREIQHLKKRLDDGAFSSALSNPTVSSKKKPATKAELKSAVANCVAKEEYESMRVRFDELDRKVSGVPSIQILDQVLSQKVDIQTLSQALKDHEPKFDDVYEMIDARVDAVKQEVEIRQDGMLQEVVRVVESNTAEIQSSLASKVSQTDFLDAMGLKIGTAELETRLKGATDAIGDDVKKAIRSVQSELVEVLNKKAFISDVEKQIDTRASKNDIKRLVAKKAEVSDVREALTTKATAQDLQKVLEKHHSLDQKIIRLETIMDEASQGRGGMASKTIETDLQELKEELAGRASIDDICTLLDQKANIVDVNDALKNVNHVLSDFEAKLGGDDKSATALEKVQKTMTRVQQVVDAEMVVGRWIWKSGRVGSDRAVPWNVQSINTAPENFVWTKDGVEITTAQPGLYQVTMGFFSDKDPAVQLLVNGEPAITAVRDAQQHYNSNRLAGAPSSHRSAGKTSVIRRGRHSSGNVTGWTLLDFVALPTRAQIAVLYDGDPTAQGFLGLRKL